MTGSATIADRISAAMPSLTGAEKRAARALLARYPMIGLDSVTAFAEAARVSPPSILRFIAKLGLDGYADFRRALREELATRSAGPLSLPRSDAAPSDALRHGLVGMVEATLGALPEGDVDRVVALLADERRRVFVLGGAFTAPVADHLLFHLRKIRGRTVRLATDLPERVDQLVDVGRRDTLLVFDVRRYQRDVVETARMMAERGAAVVLVTDVWMSEIAEFAAAVIRCRIDAPTPWDSLLGPMAAVELIAARLDAALWSRTRPRLETIFQIRDRLARAAAADPGPEAHG